MCVCALITLILINILSTQGVEVATLNYITRFNNRQGIYKIACSLIIMLIMLYAYSLQYVAERYVRQMHIARSMTLYVPK